MAFWRCNKTVHHTVTIKLELKMAVLTQAGADAIAATITQLATDAQAKLASLPDDNSLQAAVANLAAIVNPPVIATTA